MNEYGLHELLGVLCDAVGLTAPPQGFYHAYPACAGVVSDCGQYWQCGACGQRYAKPMSPAGQSPAYETQRRPTPTAMSHVSAKLGAPNMSYSVPPVAQYISPPTVSVEQIRNALGISPERMDAFIEEITRPEPTSPIEHVDQDLRKYTERI